jgi:hypothetical protein
MKAATALLPTIAALASAAPSVNDVLLSARQLGCEYPCSCMDEHVPEIRNNANTDVCCAGVGRIEVDLAAWYDTTSPPLRSPRYTGGRAFGALKLTAVIRISLY